MPLPPRASTLASNSLGFLRSVPPMRAAALSSFTAILGGTIAWAAIATSSPGSPPSPSAQAPKPAPAAPEVTAPAPPATPPAAAAPALPQTGTHPVLAQARPITPPPVSSPHQNYLASDDGSIHTAVGTYSDCSGELPLTREMAAINTCITGRLYFVGHAFGGVFTGMAQMGVGSGITYYDGASRAHHYTVVSVRPNWPRAGGAPPVTQGNVTAQFQSSAVPDGSADRILDAVGDALAPTPAPAAHPAPTPTPAPAPTAVAPTFFGFPASSGSSSFSYFGGFSGYGFPHR